jgi:NAD(P)-dependent dehydrogenase (short-subunit alcohol dehydrogenase family)
MRLDGKRALVTGGGRNVGEAIALRFCGEGATVAVVDVDEQAAGRTAARLNEVRQGAGIALQCDVSSNLDVEAMTGRAWDAMGGIDILVNSVAITDRGRTVLDLTYEEWSRVLNVTLGGTFNCCQHVAKRMVDAGVGGSIVNIGSTSGYQPRGNALAYPTAKTALYGFSRSAALQLGPRGIRVNCVTPNKVGSPVGQAEESTNRSRNNLIGRSCTPEDIAQAVTFIASSEASFITGADLVVDGGALISASMD